MVLLLDTGILIEIYQGNDEVVSAVQEQRRPEPDNPAITFAQYSEFHYGFQDKSEGKREQAEEFLDKFTYLFASPATAQRFTQLKHRLDEEGEPIPLMDLFIAALALEKGVTVVTTDQHFERIEELSPVVLEAG